MMEEQFTIRDTYDKLKSEHLSSIGIENDIIKEVLSYQLLIERLGERDNNDWWKSKLFTKFGRKSLEEVLPKSWTKARIKLAREIGLKSEKTKIQEEDYVSLFYLGPYFEHLMKKELEKIDSQNDFKYLENLNIRFDESGWGENFGDSSVETEIKNTPCLGEISKSDLEDDESILFFAKNLFYAYSKSTEKNLIVPYYVIKDE